MNYPESIEQITIQKKVEAFELASTWIPGIKILQQVEPAKNLFICERGIQRYGLSQGFFKHLPTKEFKSLVFDADSPETCLLAVSERNFGNYPETRIFLQRQKRNKNLPMELVIVKYLNFDSNGVPLLSLTQILPLPFQPWASTKVNRIIHEISFKKQNREKFKQLSTRNKEVLSHMTCCTKAEDISELLGISVNTVNTHKKKIKDLLVLEGSCEVVWYGLAFDLLKF
ncbi:hypothetical protein GCM10009119_10870 [Algoriphagus jejuensis]|uniref:HTH luxR-type domain-containing protein n=1 Tax=Algoriphagus jejuensis TaxID=419934 RepID=A0ABP3Y9B8_9BACT